MDKVGYLRCKRPFHSTLEMKYVSERASSLKVIGLVHRASAHGRWTCASTGRKRLNSKHKNVPNFNCVDPRHLDSKHTETQRRGLG